MILKSETDQTEFELRLAGYQFPRNEHDEWDANWLMVSVRVDCPVASWTCTDPCLTTMEAHELATWLGSQALDESTQARIFFLEPNLSFEVVKRHAGVCDLRLCFAAECRPPGIGVGYGGEEFSIPIRVCSDDLRRAANQLCQELRQFPIRANPPRPGLECRQV